MTKLGLIYEKAAASPLSVAILSFRVTRLSYRCSYVCRHSTYRTEF